MNKITVITANYGHEKYISQAIESVLTQTYSDFEYIIFDDASKDSSRDVIEEYAKKDNRIKFYTHENIENKGLPATIETAVALVKSPYIAFLESDDIWKPTFLEKMIKVAEKSENIGLFYADVEVLGEDESNNRKHTKMLNKRKKFVKHGEIIRIELLYERFISTFSSVLVRSSLLKNCRFNPIIPQRLDNYLWSQCLLSMDATYIDEVLCQWRKHNESYSRTLIEPDNFISYDMLFDILYPEHTEKDKAFYHFLLSGKKEKIFRNQIRYFLKFYFNIKYPYKKLKVFTVC